MPPHKTYLEACMGSAEVFLRKKPVEKEIINDAYNEKANLLVTGKVERRENLNVYLDVDGNEGVLYEKEQTCDEVGTYKIGQMVRCYVSGVRNGRDYAQLLLSRTHPNLVRKLFELEVPEIADGIVEIKGVAREGGSRTKIAVYSADENVDPIGACIGPKGTRVGTIVESLGGEKIDIVVYDEDPQKFIGAALAPADVLSVEIDEEKENACHVTVPDTQLSLAIGNKGQNARLAARLTGWKIDIKPESGFYIPQNQ